jgi:coproporphyrinogen III oxidase-like Fe-S oxidoreductase
MFIEKFLSFYSARLARRYFTFEKYSPTLPPKAIGNKPYLLYIHIPFCEELCSYCSFVRVKFELSLASDYFDVLKKEIETYHQLGYRFDSVYIGGGTPTIMPEKLAGIVDFVKSNWQIKQISVETNPNHLVPETLDILRGFGTNRLSIGVQSFNNTILKSIQRFDKYGSSEEIKEKVFSVAGMFDTVNIDMIFNFPNQTVEMLAEDLEVVKELRADQVTYYPLIVSNVRKEEFIEICKDINYGQEKELYRQLVSQLAGIYKQESIWCFSRKNGVIDEYIIDHDEYVGVGPGSWGYINGTMHANTFSVEQYVRMVQDNKFAITARRDFSYLEQMRYYFLLELLSGTMNISDIQRKYGKRFWLYLCRELLFFFITKAVIIQDNNIILTPKGRYYWIIMMRTLFSIVGDYRDMRTSLDARVSI